jgi:hypothetical protein
MTRTLGLAFVLGIIAVGTTFAQTATSTTPVVNPPAVSLSEPDSKTAAAPVAGANSFTEAQARSRVEAHGYVNVTGLKKDANSIWRGKATKGGASVDVALDYRGNIVANH